MSETEGQLALVGAPAGDRGERVTAAVARAVDHLLALQQARGQWQAPI